MASIPWHHLYLENKSPVPFNTSNLPLMGIDSWATGRDTTESGVAKTPNLDENSINSLLTSATWHFHMIQDDQTSV